jgi:DNA-binding transcriptional regulator GbsR (MarR family)
MPAQPTSDSSVNEQLEAVQDQFILEWGRMSSNWGINRTMAQIHALLLVSASPLSMDQIIDRLMISRGNASMNLRDLIDWGVIQRFRQPGQRKDTYECRGDVLEMFARVVRERKRREIDPTVGALKECIASAPDRSASKEAEHLSDRLESLLEVFTIIDKVFQQVFVTDASFRDTIKMFKG